MPSTCLQRFFQLGKMNEEPLIQLFPIQLPSLTNFNKFFPPSITVYYTMMRFWWLVSLEAEPEMGSPWD